ncbi:MAG: DNA translocase FtsK [Chloroflexi bacterium]|nr:DNA translocase FtsK [Chloroflexota bacterium]MCY4247677.1 DNA translocase FtsK [Chloroflexota bacterium]
MAYRRDDESEYIEDDDFFDSEAGGGRSRVLGGSGSRQPREFDQPPEDVAAARQPNNRPRPQTIPKKARNPSPSSASDQERRDRLAGKHNAHKKAPPSRREEPPASADSQAETGRFGKLRARLRRSPDETEPKELPAQSRRTAGLAALGGLRSRFDKAATSASEPQRPAPRQQPQSKRPNRAPKLGSSDWLDLDRKLDLVGVALVFGAILYAISALSAEQAAIGALHMFVGQSLGWGAVALPLAMFAIGLWLIVRHFGDEPPIIDPLRMAGAVMAFLGALALLQYLDSLGYAAVMPTIPACVDATSSACVEALVREAYQQARGGGVVGGWLYSALVNALTELGGLVAVSMLLTVGAMLITRSSATELALAGISLWRGARTRLGQYAAVRRAARMQAQQPLAQTPVKPPLHIRKPDAPRLDRTARAAPALPEPRSDWMPIPTRLRAFFGRRQTAAPPPEKVVAEAPQAPAPYPSRVASPYAAPPAARQKPPAGRTGATSGALQRFRKLSDDLPKPPASAAPVNRPQPATPRPKPAPPATAKPAEPPPPLPAAPAQTRLEWELPNYQSLLDSVSAKDLEQEPLMQQARIIEDTLAAFGAPGNVIEINSGPVITQYGVEPLQQTASTGKRSRVKVGDIAKLDKDLQLALGAKSIRMEAPVPGKGYVGIEVPNPLSARVSLRDVLESASYRKLESPLAVALGMTVDGTPVAADLAQMPHLLIAGATGAGKSVCVNAIINSILLRNSPETAKFIMIDPKRVELTSYNGLPHLVAPVVVELERAIGVLRWVTAEMEKRYQTLYQAGMLNIIDYNKTLDPDLPPMSYIVVIIDELADLMMLAPKEIELIVRRIVAVARATGIHMILATQRPSVDVVTGVIKANCPARIAFSVASGVDSRVILGVPGAERLLGKGDMLYLSGDAPAPRRMQGVFVSEDEKQRIGKFWRIRSAGIEPVEPIAPPQHSGASTSALPPAAAPDNLGEQAAFWEMSKPDADRQASTTEDDLYQTAVEMVRRLDRASISLLQRKMRIGYGRAARLMDMMEERGVVGPAKEGSSKPRDVLPLA